MNRNPINLSILSRKDDGEPIAVMVDKIPDFKSWLFDDLSQLVFQRLIDSEREGAEVIVIFPFDGFVNLFNEGRIDQTRKKMKETKNGRNKGDSPDRTKVDSDK